MKPGSLTIFSRISLLVAGIITALAVVFVVMTYVVATNYYESSTQLLNKDVAAHIAEFTSPFSAQGLDREKADSVFHDAMVLSPNAEVYFLDTSGTVIAYYEASEQPSVRLWNIPLAAIRRHIAAGNADYIKNQDPRDPEHPKIFSAAEVIHQGQKLGYIYVILAGSEARQVASLLLSNHVIVLSLITVSCIVGVSLLFSILYVRRIRQRFNRVVAVLHRFQEGDFSARFTIHRQDGLGPIKEAFNRMADMLVEHIHRLTQSEADRKAFVAGITHDLRTPLSVAAGYAETLGIKRSSGSLTPQQSEEYTGLVLQKIRQLEQMVTQLYELSAMDSVAFEPKREPFMFSELLQEIAEGLRLQADAIGVSINCERCKDDTFICADIAMMERVIQNLLVNAVTYCPEGEIITAALSHEANLLLFSIRNRSAHLPAGLLAWLNTDGVAGAPTAQTGRASIGLTIVKRILQLHHYPLHAVVYDSHICFEIRMQQMQPRSR